MVKPFAVHLDEETKRRLSFIEDASSMSPDQMAEEAIKSYSQEKEKYIKAIRLGQDDVSHGRTSSHEALIKDLETRLADLD